jgi:oligopeptide transport system permease protein
MVNDGYDAIFADPLLVLAPGIAIAITMLAFTFVGDGLRDALDPRMRR